MIRKIIIIDEDKCNGCGLCAVACHEGAIDMIDGKAKLVRENFCDGLGDCLPACPQNAITFEEREAPAYDAEAVEAAQRAANANRFVLTEGEKNPTFVMPEPETVKLQEFETHSSGSELHNWPPQIKLAPVTAPYYDGAKLLIAADCTAFAYANLHHEFMHDKVTLIGCPKLDAVDYSQKLAEIISSNEIQQITVVRMEVPCCGGLENAVMRALQASGKVIPWQVFTISRSGKILK